MIFKSDKIDAVVFSGDDIESEDWVLRTKCVGDKHIDNETFGFVLLRLFNKLLYDVIGLDQLPPTEVGGLFLSSVVKRLKADSLPKDSVLWPYTFYTVK